MSAPSARVAALAFALSSWVEGLSQLRAVMLTPSIGIPREEEEEFHQPPSLLPSSTSWKDRFVAWFRRNGRREVQIDDTERTSLGAVDIATAFFILQMLRQPLLPFMLSPFLTTLPLPRSKSAFKSIRMPHLIISTLLLSLLYEAERVSVFLTVDFMKQRRDARNKALLGDVYVRGDDLRRHEVDEEADEEECLICAGAGADTSLSQSISSLSSMAAASASLDTLGPLEAFCATAPQKHVAHRSCFLSWHAAYRQQRLHLAPEHVELQHPRPTEANRNRARAILEAAGFAHLGRLIKFPHELPWTRTYPATSESRPLIRPAFSLTENSAGPSEPTSAACTSLATLHTTTPPCPGCRSSVLLHFFSRPPLRLRDSKASCNRQEIKALIQLWVHHWCKLVTGRTVLYRLASQWSFVVALLSMMRASRASGRWIYA